MVCAAPLLLTAGGTDESASAGDTAAAAGPSSDRVRLPIGQYNMDDYVARTGAEIVFSDSPFLAGKGLPPVEERLPDNPVVMETWIEDGKYGGTLTWTEYTIDYDHYLRHLNAVQLMEIAPSASNHRYNFVGAEIQPSVLERWEQNDAADEFTFTIRKGLKWSDGVPVTTEDVRFAFEDNYFNEEITPTLPTWAKWGGEPVKLSIVDDYTFSLSFAKPYGLFLSELTGRAPGHFMRPAHYMKQFHTAYTDIKDIEGVMKEQGYSAEEWGKFYNSYDVPSQTAASYVPTRYPNAIEAPSLHPWNVIDEPNPSEFLLERNPYFYKIDPTGKQLPYIDRGHRIFVTDLEVMTAKIVAGETDLQFQFIRLGDFPLFKSNEEKGGYRTMALPAWQDQLLIYFASLTPEDHVYAEIVQDKRFRQAVSLAIDRTEVKKSVFLDFGREAQYAPPKGSDVWEQYMDDAYMQYDVDAANALLDEMGLEWDAKGEYRLMPDGRRLAIPFHLLRGDPDRHPRRRAVSRVHETDRHRHPDQAGGRAPVLEPEPRLRDPLRRLVAAGAVHAHLRPRVLQRDGVRLAQLDRHQRRVRDRASRRGEAPVRAQGDHAVHRRRRRTPGRPQGDLGEPGREHLGDRHGRRRPGAVRVQRQPGQHRQRRG